MLLTITTTHQPATDLGFLLHKHPERVQEFNLSYGKARVFYPEAAETRCTAALYLDVDPVSLIRSKTRNHGFALHQYVNDRPYTASSFLSVAIARVYTSALAGVCKDRPQLVDQPIPLEVTLSVLPDESGGDLIWRLFQPLGYQTDLKGYPLDPRFPEWGESPYFTVTLRQTIRLADLLTHLYVLIPVLDNDKHYWVGDDEVEKLLARGAGWLEDHPEKDLIVRRYLKYRAPLARAALAQLMADEPLKEEEEPTEVEISLQEQRMDTVLATLRELKPKRVLDLGCGEGKLLQRLLRENKFEEITGLDIAYRALEKARDRLQLDRLPDRQREKIKLLHGSLIYRDDRLNGYDAAAVVEVIEHMDQARLAAFETVLFRYARPGAVLVTTPNREYNVRYESLAAGELRHKDHRFEWTREEFRQWAKEVAERHGYQVTFGPVGPEDPQVGAPGQMGVFTR